MALAESENGFHLLEKASHLAGLVCRFSDIYTVSILKNGKCKCITGTKVLENRHELGGMKYLIRDI